MQEIIESPQMQAVSATPRAGRAQPRLRPLAPRRPLRDGLAFRASPWTTEPTPAGRAESSEAAPAQRGRPSPGPQRAPRGARAAAGAAGGAARTPTPVPPRTAPAPPARAHPPGLQERGARLRARRARLLPPPRRRLHGRDGERADPRGRIPRGGFPGSVWISGPSLTARSPRLLRPCAEQDPTAGLGRGRGREGRGLGRSGSREEGKGWGGEGRAPGEAGAPQRGGLALDRGAHAQRVRPQGVGDLSGPVRLPAANLPGLAEVHVLGWDWSRTWGNHRLDSEDWGGGQAGFPLSLGTGRPGEVRVLPPCAVLGAFLSEVKVSLVKCQQHGP